MTRYSVNRDDPGFAAYRELRFRGLDLRVFVDGVEATGVHTLETGEPGAVWEHRHDANGRPITEAFDPGTIATFKRVGVVTVVEMIQPLRPLERLNL